MTHSRTDSSRFLTKLLHNPVYRKAHKIDDIIQNIQDGLRTQTGKHDITLALLHYVEDKNGKSRLAVTALLNGNSSAPVSCIQGALTRGTFLALQMCAEYDLVLFNVVPDSFTTNLSGIHISADGVSNLDWT